MGTSHSISMSHSLSVNAALLLLLLVKPVRFPAAVWVSLLLGEWMDLSYFSLCTNLSKNRKNLILIFKEATKNLSFIWFCLLRLYVLENYF